MTKNVLCAVDDTEYSNVAVAQAAELARALDAALTLLIVNEFRGRFEKGGTPKLVWSDDDIKRILDVSATVAKKNGFGGADTKALISRDVARAIVVHAEEIGADHIVVGTGGKGNVSRLMLGSVSRDVVFRAHCSVTVAR